MHLYFLTLCNPLLTIYHYNKWWLRFNLISFPILSSPEWARCGRLWRLDSPAGLLPSPGRQICVLHRILRSWHIVDSTFVNLLLGRQQIWSAPWCRGFPTSWQGPDFSSSGSDDQDDRDDRGVLRGSRPPVEGCRASPMIKVAWTQAMCVHQFCIIKGKELKQSFQY